MSERGRVPRSVRSAARWAGWVLLVAVAVPCVLVTLLRAGGLDAGWAVRLEAFTPAALPGYLLLTVALGVLAARRRSRVGLLAAVVALTGLVLHLVWFAPLLLGATPAPAPDAAATVVMTANVLRGSGDPGTLVHAVVTDHVDVLVVSEITPEFAAGLAAAGLDVVLPHAVGRPDPDVAGTMVFARDPLTVDERLDTVFRGYVVRTDGLSLLAAHPVAPTDPAAWRADHALIREAAEREGPDVILGDLNATLDHEPVRRLLDDGWRDAVELTNGGWAPTWPADGSLLPFPAVQIDHVLVRGGFTVTEVHEVDVPGSDHRAVVATVSPAA